MKAVSTIFVVVILIVIAIALASSTYIFFNRVFVSTANSENSSVGNSMSNLGLGLQIDAASGNTVYIRNTGTSDLENFLVFVNGVQVSFNIDKQVLHPDEVGTITINDCVDGSNLGIRVTGQGVKAYILAHKMSLCLVAEPPTFTNLFSNVTNNTAVKTGIPIKFGAQWSDDVAVSMYVNSSSVSGGSWTNDTWQTFTAGNWSNFTVNFPSVTNSNLTVDIYANDTSNNQVATDMFFWYNTTSPDITPPIYSLNSTNSTTAGMPTTFNLNWYDGVSLSGYIFSFDNCTGALKNSSWVPMTGSINWSNVTNITNFTVGCPIRWCVYANDTSNNWNGTSCQNPFTYSTSQTFGGVLWFKLNEGAGKSIFDSSSYGNNGNFYGEKFNDGTLGNGSSWTKPTRLSGSNCMYGSCLGFGGDGDVVNISDFMPNTSLTIMAWIYPKYIGSDQRAIVSKWGTPGKTGEWLFRISSLELQFWVQNITNGYEGPVASSGANIQINGWYHVAVVYNRTSKNASFYVNGTYKGSGTFPYNGQTQNGTDIVRIGTQGGGSFDQFNGTIDEVRIFNRTLNATEIQNEMNSPTPVLRPIASYSFEEPSGATYVNDTHSWVKGKYGSSMSFDGVNDFINVSDSNSLDVSNITIAAWIYPLSFGSSTMGRIADKSGSFMFYVYNSTDYGEESLYFYYWNSTPSSSDQSAPYMHLIKLNTWQYVTVTYDGTYVRYYYNGVLNSTHTSSAPGPIRATASNLYVGFNSSVYTNPNRAFNGTIDEVRIWNRTLSQPEIATEMSRG